MNRTDHTAAVEPRAARVSSRVSGEGAPVRPKAPPARPRPATAAAQHLRHNITAPEKKTLKRIEALRRSLRSGVDEDGVVVDVVAVRSKIDAHLRLDRGLAGHVDTGGCAVLAERMVDPARFMVAAATMVGEWLRDVGGIERGTVTPDRIKAALSTLQDALYDHDAVHSPIATWVRDIKIEKRDGGLQLLAVLRLGADAGVVSAALRHALDRAGHADVVLRAEPAVAPASATARARLW
jgi:hypothetical protein